MSLRQLWNNSPWNKLRHRDRYEQDLSDELAFHFESRRDALIAQGCGFDEATRIARQELGMVELHKDAVRAAHGLAGFDQWLGELRRALRSLARSPMFTLAAIVILGAAIGVNLVLFSIYGSYALRAPEVVGRGELVDLDLRDVQGGNLPTLNVDELRSIAPALDAEAKGVLISTGMRMRLGGDAPVTAYGLTVNGAYFKLLDAHTDRGRVLNENDDRSDAAPTLLLSDHGWRSLTAADPDVIGKSLSFNGTEFVVVGVMPPGYVDLQTFTPQFWVTVEGYEQWRRRFVGDDVATRYEVSLILGEGGTPESLRQRLLPALQSLPDRQSDDGRIGDVRVLPRRSLLAAEDTEDLNLAAVPVFALVLLVLVVACANLANLMLARATAQRQELAIRASVGASRWRLMRQLLTESALLALSAALLGLLICAFAAEPLHRYALSLMIGIGVEPIAITIDWRIFIVASTLALIATFSFGLAPALAVTGRNLAAGARRDSKLFSGSISPSKLRGSLMVLQIAASLVLLLAAALIVGTAQRADRLDIGLDVERLVDLRHPAPTPELRARIEQIDGVEGTSATTRTLLMGWQMRRSALVGSNSLSLLFNYVDEQHLRTLGLPLLQGRNFRTDEAANEAPVAMISAATAALLWPNANPLGQRIRFVADINDPDARDLDVEVIGVVADIASGLLFTGRDASMVYRPTHLGAANTTDLIVAIDASRSQAVVNALIAACNAMDAKSPCLPMPLPEMLAMQRLPFSIARNISTALGLVALLISAVGLYGVVRFTVASRAREIGVRVALGATPAGVVKLVLRGAVRQVLLGIAIGLPLCLGLSFMLSGPLGHSLAFAPLAYATVPALLLATALLATVLPARRATRIAPTEALRQD